MPYISSFYVTAAAVALLGWLGWFVDDKLQTKPIFFISGLFIGLITGFYNLYKLLMNLEKDK
jgi:F0F1-type ATP synthase assembly protein I